MEVIRMPRFDFGGWVSKYNVQCTDGTTIKPGCFAAQNGEQVPLMWMHNHDEIGQCIGHAILEHRDEGIYAWGKLNDGDGGRQAKAMLKNGDVNSLSLWANNLKRNAGDIMHGVIKEVSMVISGADPQATIDCVLAHGELSETEAEIWGFGKPELCHSDDDGPKPKEENKVDNEKDKKEPEKKEPEKKDGDKTVGEVLDSLTDEQKKAVGMLIEAIEKRAENKETPKPKDEDEKGNDMKHNVFDNDAPRGSYISHDDMNQIFKDAKKMGSLKDAFHEHRESGVLAHADEDEVSDYGIMAGHTNYTVGDTPAGGLGMDYLFPEAKTLNNIPEFIKRNTDWVDDVLSSVHRTPFARVKSVFADITEDEARAKGYIKGKYKKEEVFSLLKRVTEPQTIYKKQKMDKQDIDDITDFSVVAWVKAEMQLMLREEVARALLIGDGRLASDDDKIQEDHIRPVFKDEDLFTIKYAVEIAADATEDEKAKALERAIIKSRKLYKGSGNPKFYTTEDEVTNMLLRENGIGDRIYKTEEELRTALRVKGIRTVEPMEGLKIGITENNVTTQYDVAGVLVNLNDYNVGTNGGAKTDFFDDFDIDYNQYKYLYETRLSGAMIKPFAAITFYYKVTA
jgi:HK97 family phage prohead protease